MNTVHSAVRWKIIDQGLVQGLGLVAAMVLARLIAPAEFGLFAMLILLLVLGDTFAKGGLAMALVQRQDTTADDESTVFWFNMVIASVLAIILYLIAPAVATFFEQERLTLILRVLVLDLLLSATITVPIARLTKQLAFQRLALISALSVGGGGLVAIVLAFAGWGVWALVAQLLATSGISLVAILVLERWRPRFVFAWQRFKTLLDFGAFHMGATLMTLMSRQAYTVFVGKLYTPAALGVFNRAVNTRGLPQNFIGSAYRGVGFPVLARQSGEPAAFQATLRASMVAVMALTLPVMAGLSLVAGDLVPVLFGSNWMGVVPFLQILCIGGIAWALNMVNLNALSALGEARRVFRLQFFVQILLLALVALTAQFNLVALAIGMSLAEFVAAFLSSRLLRQRLGYGLTDQLQDLAPYLGLLALMTGAVLAQRTWFPFERPLYGLMVSVTLGVTVYVVPMLLLRLEAVDHGLALLRKEPQP